MKANPNSPFSAALTVTILGQQGPGLGASTSGTSAMVEAAIENIRFDIVAAIEWLERNAAEKGTPLSKNDLAKLYAGRAAYLDDLRQVVSAAGQGMKRQFHVAKNLLLHSYPARLYAVLRALQNRGATVTLDELHARAKELSVLEPLQEAVVVRWVAKGGKPGYRPIVVSGIMRTAQALILRDMLSMMGVDSEVDCTRKGGGGEKALIEAICNDIEDEYHWWWTPDIKDCFGSITPPHLGWLPIDRRLIRNVAYLPKCARIVVPHHKDAEAILQSLYAKHPDLSEDGLSLQALTVRIVQRGLLQGSVLSPLLARAVVYREVNVALSHKELKCYSYCDDLSIGARTKGECRAAKQALTDHLSSLPAGPIELHEVKTRNANNQRVLVLGYSMEAGKGHGDNNIHVKPWIKRTDKFKHRLVQKFEAAPAEANLFEIAEKYWRQWYGSQGAWTKIPLFSEEVSRSITASYVSDFIDGIPLGTWKLNKPPLQTRSLPDISQSY
jgi:hypothetical protein